MENIINIYCDESCHLLKDNNDCMILGYISCPKSYVKKINKDIREIKLKYNLNKNFEIKWIKVSPSKLDFYLELIRYFIKNPFLSFRCVVATGKSKLNHELFRQTHDEWYYKMYYLLLQSVKIGYKYKVYIDIKDTHGGDKIKKLKDILNNRLNTCYDETIQGIQIIKSNESEIMQLDDLLIGAISYINRNLDSSKAKMDIIDYLKKNTGLTLKKSTSLSASKFNIFVWRPRE